VCVCVCVCTLLVYFLETQKCMVGMCDQAIHMCVNDGCMCMFLMCILLRLLRCLMLEIVLNFYYRPYAIDCH